MTETAFWAAFMAAWTVVYLLGVLTGWLAFHPKNAKRRGHE